MSNCEKRIQKWVWVILWISFSALGCLFMQRVYTGSSTHRITPILRIVIFSMMSGIAVFIYRSRLSLSFLKVKNSRSGIWHVSAGVLLIVAALFFPKTWINLSIISRIAGRFGISASRFLWCISAVLAVFAYPAMLFLLKCFLGEYLELPEIICREKRYLLPGFAVLAVVFCFIICTVIRADYIYKDDMGRFFWGNTDYHRESRFGAEFVSFLLHLDLFYADVSPLTQLLEMILMALAAVLLFSILFPDKKPGFLTLCSMLPIAVNPYFMECISFKYDPPQHACAVLLNVIPFLLCRRERKKYLLASTVFVMLACTFHQVPMTFYISIALLLCLISWNSGEWSGKESLVFGVQSAAAWAAGLFLYRFGIMNRMSIEHTHISTEIWTLKEMIPGVIKNYRTFFRCIINDYANGWLILIVILCIAFVGQIVRNSVRKPAAAMFFGAGALLALLLLSNSLYPLLNFVLYSPRHMYSFGLFLALISMTAVSLSSDRAVVTRTAAILLGMAFTIFAFVYGNSLLQQKEYTDYRINRVLTRLTEIVSENKNKRYVVKVEGTTGFAPSIDVLPPSLNMIRRLVTTSLNDYHSTWYATGLYYYYGLPLRAVEASDPDYQTLDLQLYSEDFYDRIYTDGQYILVSLTDR